MNFHPDNFHRAVADYDQSWRATDQVLYDLCRQRAGHADRAGINAKLWIIGRAYATGIERKISSNGRQGGSISQLADHMVKLTANVDDIFAQLRQIHEPLDPDKIRAILDLHGRFIAILRPVL